MSCFQLAYITLVDWQLVFSDQRQHSIKYVVRSRYRFPHESHPQATFAHRLGKAWGSLEVGAGFVEQLCILTYLISVKDLPLTNKLVKAERLPGGEFFFRGPHGLGTEKLAKAFGERPELLYEASEGLGGERRVACAETPGLGRLEVPR